MYRNLKARHDARSRELKCILSGPASPRAVATADAALALSRDPTLGPIQGELADALNRELFL